ncbi:hypothetical protein [Streptomyces sp. NPDC088139]|uniref:hypothetical protein n=1 Tax=Streptomyces sp. NPDC088139 TaxID=3365828 RepID=UPI00380898B4
MSASHQDIALHRRRYTGESVQQAHRAIDNLKPGTAPIPVAASPAQQDLEARVLLSLLEFRNSYTRYPLGIASVHPQPDGIALQVESMERAAEILFNLLPTYVSEDEVHGVPGLRITRRGRTAIELSVLGEAARVRLTGLPARLWRDAVTRMLAEWTDPDDLLLRWRASPKAWTDAEQRHRVRWDDPADHFTHLQRQGLWLGSGLLRRAALLHTVSNTFFVDGYRGATSGKMRLVLRSSHVRTRGPGPHHIVAALTDPTFGLPLHLTRFRGDTDEHYARQQQFVLGDLGQTAALDLQCETDRPPSGLKPELWQLILRRLPAAGVTSSLSPGVLAGLFGLGAA